MVWVKATHPNTYRQPRKVLVIALVISKNATDVQFDPENSDLMAEWNAMEQSEEEIRFVVDNILKD